MIKMTSVLVKSQKKTFTKFYEEDGKRYKIIANVRYDDECGKGHNTFAITGQINEVGGFERGGCIHEEIGEHFPELAQLIEWHSCSSDGPMHYVENSMYWAGKRGWCNGKPGDPPYIKHFRSMAFWPEATQKDMENVTEEILLERLPKLMEDFRRDVEDFGFTF